MTVYITYLRGSPQGMKAFLSKLKARKWVNKQTWPNNYVVHRREVK